MPNKENDQGLKPRCSPCASCPYRCGVPSGIWSREEYEKLPAYDGDIADQLENPEQGLAVFLCHLGRKEVCAGWLGHRENPSDLLAVRMGISSGYLDPRCLDYETEVELLDSGRKAAEHGMRGIIAPDEQAQRAISKIMILRSRSAHPLDEL